MKKYRGNRKVGEGAKLGQHFLNNPHYAQLLVNAAGITPNDTVLEIGPGTGALTKFLLRSARRVVAVEKDGALAAALKASFSGEISRGVLDIFAEDVRDFTPEAQGLRAGEYILAANIPYYITGEIIRQFLETSHPPKTIALLIQREVAQRIVSTKESILSLSVKAYGAPKIIAKVTKGNFTPPPSVDSAILAITNISKKNFAGVDEKHFFTIVRAGFSSKRKLLAGNLGGVFGKERVAAAFAAAVIDAKARAENVPLEKWLILAAQLKT
jgi:16S rRNA (adenine1518-N6/adenine1519-N6)-dimethyltransferase